MKLDSGLGNVGAAGREDSDGAGDARVCEVDGPLDEVVAGGPRPSEVDVPLDEVAAVGFDGVRAGKPDGTVGEAVAGGGSGAEESTKF